MSIDNVLASVAVKDLDSALAWYKNVLGRPPDSTPMPEVVEWKLERAGSGSFTLAVSDIEDEVRKIGALGIDVNQRSSSKMVKTLMISDPDGNHIAFAEAFDPTMAK
jgi:catechol 2,3-dioxygenase-like lactoylglutathione lyase family enzyme